MKKNYLLSAAAAFLLAVTGCSDDLGNGNDPAPEEDGNKVYMTVNVSTVSQGAMTKAGGESSTPNDKGAGWGENGNGFLEELNGSNEGKVYDVNIFLVPTDNDELNASNQLTLLNTSIANAKDIQIAGQGYYSNPEGIDASAGGKEPNHGDGNVTLKVTMKKPLTETASYFQVFAVINAGGRLTGINTLADLRERTAKAESERKLWTAAANIKDYDHFVMSTHKMISSETPSNGTSLVSLSVKNMDETSPAHTTVFVERLAARIDLGYAETLALNIPATSPVKDKGTFTLERYLIVNQWKDECYLFKQVSPRVNRNYGEGSALPAANVPYDTGDPLQYLGDEWWQWTSSATSTTPGAGSYNYVLDPKIRKKVLPEGETTYWDLFKDSYINYFNESNTALNDVDKMVNMPTSGSSYHESAIVNGNSEQRTYYPVAYTRENTLDRESQVHGYTTGVIFESEFKPDDNFKVSYYDGGKINSVNLSNDKTFLSAAHHNDDGTVSVLVYKDVKTVAACAFNLDKDTKDLLKGFMDGWGNTTNVTIEDVRNAIGGMSFQNGLESAFKDYLELQIKDANSFTEDIKSKLTYKAFREQAKHLPSTIIPAASFTPTQIGNLYQYYGVSLYKSGRSYHKFWIRHDDNGNDGVMGVMEFCIVRNNVYQLYVTGIRGLGDPLPYTPGKDDPNTPDESDDVTIDVTIYVKNWVKRTNKDIII